ncbi:MAG TPA: YfhO family protein [Lactobacillaceae bacterium]|jgi:uncharacterized membrane protein YfhO
MLTRRLKRWFTPLSISFLLPAGLLLGYFIYRGMAPFGDSSILTVDLGQQYVDQFAWFKHTLQGQPSGFFYSFANALGGDMISEWAYYLMSPFNLIFVFVPLTWLPSAVLFVTVAKIGAAGWTFAYALHKLNWQRGWALPIFGVQYALMGWFVANDLNLLWLDSVILLPLVVLALEKLLRGGRVWPYPLLLAAAIITNYYMGYMIALFLVLYVGWRLLWPDLAGHRLRAFWRSGYTSLLGGGLTFWLLAPTLYQLKLGKAQYQSTLTWGFDNNPLDLLMKLIPGSFNFSQMQAGVANWFVSAFAFVALMAFFAARHLPRRVKIGAVALLGILILATTWAPLTLLWHGLQYPVWYPYRFSFLLSFWVLWLGALAWRSDFVPRRFSWAFLLLLFGGTVAWSVWRLKATDYISWQQLLIFSGFSILIVMAAAFAPRDRSYRGLLLLLVSAEMFASVVLTLNGFSYLTNSEFQRTVRALQSSQTSTQTDTSWYRTAQTFQRTRGDAMMIDSHGGAHFSSALPKATTTLFANLGQPDGDNYVAYTNGTKLTDALLDMKYVWTPNGKGDGAAGEPNTHLVSYRADLSDYVVKSTTARTYIWQNPNALALGYAANSAARVTKFAENQPLTNQNNWLDGLTGTKTAYFTPQNFTGITVKNLNQPTTITGALLTKKQLGQPAEMSLTFNADGKNSYYLTLGGNVSVKDVDIYLNNQKLSQFDSYRHTIVLNLAASGTTGVQTLTFKPKVDTLSLTNVTLYQLNEAKFQAALKSLRQHTWQITSSNNRALTGKITTTKNQSLIATSVPSAPGWQAYLDGKKVQTTTVANSFLAVNTTPGTHTLSLRYTPPFWWLGVGLSLISALVLAWLTIREKKKR